MSSIATRHPAPHRGRIGLTSLLFCLAAPPIAWTSHLAANFVLADRACLPAAVALGDSTIPNRSPIVDYGPSAGALVICLIAAVIAYVNWRRTRGEKTGSHQTLLEIGEGRARFMALCGLFAAIGFAVATAFDSLSLLMARTCGT